MRSATWGWSLWPGSVQAFIHCLASQNPSHSGGCSQGTPGQLYLGAGRGSCWALEHAPRKSWLSSNPADWLHQPVACSHVQKGPVSGFLLSPSEDSVSLLNGGPHIFILHWPQKLCSWFCAPSGTLRPVVLPLWSSIEKVRYDAFSTRSSRR